jgi:hypothetical protein
MRIRNILYKCPKCSTLVRGAEYLSGNTISGAQYSDQFIKAPMAIPNGVGYIGCPNCQNAFPATEMIEVKQYEPMKEPDDAEYKNAAVPLAQFETLKIVLEDSARNADGKQRVSNLETYLRMFNHELKLDQQEEEKQNGNYQKYIDQLIETLNKLQDNPDCVVMLAEVLRERGEFDKSLEILNSAKLPEDKQRLNNAAKQIKAKAESRDPAVFEIKPLQL